MSAELLASIMVAGFGLGIVHALDPDHLMTIATLSASGDTRASSLRQATLWSLGHGALLVALAGAVALAGVGLPAAVPSGAERAVGLILILAGASALWLHHPPHGRGTGLRERAPLAVGMVHGLAGSGTMLALIPASLANPVVALLYATIFSLGVLAGMMGFGLVLGKAQRQFEVHLPGAHRIARVALGTGAMAMGAYWLQAG